MEISWTFTGKPDINRPKALAPELNSGVGINSEISDFLPDISIDHNCPPPNFLRKLPKIAKIGKLTPIQKFLNKTCSTENITFQQTSQSSLDFSSTAPVEEMTNCPLKPSAYERIQLPAISLIKSARFAWASEITLGITDRGEKQSRY